MDSDGLPSSVGRSAASISHGRAREQAFAILDGPGSIGHAELAGESFWGWPTLTLQVRGVTISPRFDVRSVYANSFN